MAEETRAVPQTVPPADLAPEIGFVEAAVVPPWISSEPPRQDLIVVFGGSSETLALLRLASVRSDDLILVMPDIDEPTRRFVDHFAVEARLRAAAESDMQGATAVIIALGDVEAENRFVRGARRAGIPLHVAGRPLVSDFTMLELVQRHAASFATRTSVQTWASSAA